MERDEGKKTESGWVSLVQERITFNVIKPRVMAKLAKQTKNRVKFDVVLDYNVQERIEIAKAAGKFLDYSSMKMHHNEIIGQASFFRCPRKDMIELWSTIIEKGMERK